MNPYPPILIASPTRSGTTMIAGLLYHHGAWIGEAKVTRAPETNPLLGTENTEIKEYLKRTPVNYPSLDFRRDVFMFLDTDGPWLVKTAQNLLKWPLWDRAFPAAKWILPLRSTEAIVESAMRHPGMLRRGAAEQRKRVEHLKGLQQDVARSCVNVLWINAHDIAMKDAKITGDLFNFCELALDLEVWDSWIEPERWHGP